MSATTTFDILANYARLPNETFEDLQNNLDDPSNGMSLESNAHKSFDMFYWCLKATGVSMAFDCLDIADGASRRKMCTQLRFSTEEQPYYAGLQITLSLSETKVTTSDPLDLLPSTIAIFLYLIRDTSQFMLP